ncbi:MAG: MFS transporter [Thermoleophilia bacterium]
MSATAVPRAQRGTLAALVAAGIAYALQQTLVIPALPVLQRDFDTTTTWITWLFTGFLLVSAVATPVLGRLGDQFGKERLLLISLGVFLVGCVASIFAWNVWSLIVFRSIQGVGGAVFPLAFAIIKDEFPAERVGSAMGLVSSVFAVGGGLGLVLSGLIVDNASWRLLFVVGAVAVAVAALLVWRFVPESPIRTPSRVDVPGVLLLSGGLIALLLALTEAESWGWGSGQTVGLLALAAVLLVAWVAFERRAAQPMVDVRMLANRTVLFTNLTAIAAGYAMLGAFVLLPNFVQMPGDLPGEVARLVDYGFDASSTKAGLFLLPGALAGFLSGPLAGVLGRRYSARVPLVLGMTMATAGLVVLALAHDEPWQIVVGMLVLGMGIPAAFAAMAKLIVDAVKPSETGVASGMNTVMRTLGGVVGGQVGAAILSADTIAQTGVPAESAFATAFWVSAAMGLLAVVLAVFVGPRRRRAGAVQPAVEAA